jgi:hypothetical protein
MKATNVEVQEAANTDSGKPEVPEDFICIDPDQRIMIFKFFTNFNPSLRAPALAHLRLCLHCREIVETMLDTPHLTTNPQDYFFIDKVVASDHAS